ncbi:MAG TPA: extracellular matrix/biofilm biosynthesis regulator RemA family protein [Dehalococcoidales bacterium]|nr:extracellular matrix/biofilm biosynthesis regulator RemA family protein [Dehalococcoidales bacterium]
MSIELVHIGFDNFLAVNRIIAIASPSSTNIKRSIKEAIAKGVLIDMTHGRKTRAAIFTDNGNVFLTSRAPEIIAGRLSVSHVGATSKTEIGDD